MPGKEKLYNEIALFKITNMRYLLKLTPLVLTLFFYSGTSILAQSTNHNINWDNQMYLGNKFTFGKSDWRFSGELQVRLENNTQSLDNYFVEGVASYLVSDNWELIPDFRTSIKPNEVEFRPGFGVIYKSLVNNFQFVNQIKWQTDFSTVQNIEHGLRYAIFFNYLIHDKYIPNFAAGAFYRWKDDFNGFQFFRFGPGIAYVSDVKHVLNINYLFSVENDGNKWHWAGIPVIQLVININKEYKYVPAKYFNF